MLASARLSCFNFVRECCVHQRDCHRSKCYSQHSNYRRSTQLPTHFADPNPDLPNLSISSPVHNQPNPQIYQKFTHIFSSYGVHQKRDKPTNKRRSEHYPRQPVVEITKQSSTSTSMAPMQRALTRHAIDPSLFQLNSKKSRLNSRDYSMRYCTQEGR